MPVRKLKETPVQSAFRILMDLAQIDSRYKRPTDKRSKGIDDDRGSFRVTRSTIGRARPMGKRAFDLSWDCEVQGRNAI
ncbi:hypothetical protein TNCV_5135951 [Trichonephila clavipes]|nr:hypothetical protein TNCV_5135951 [Trichonephila clavipes]